MRALHRLVDDVRDGVVALGRDDALGIVVELVLHLFANRLDRLEVGGAELHVGDGALLALEQLDGEPARGCRRHAVAQNALDLRDGFFHLRVEGHLRLGGLAGLRRLDGGFHELGHAVPLERRRLDDGAAQLLRQAGHVDLVAALLHEVHHVERHHDGHAQIEDLRGQVQVALEVRRVHEVHDDVGAAVQQVVARHDLLGRVRRQRVHARQVRDDHVFVAGVLPFLFLNGHARPVANVLAGAGQIVEHRRLAAVRVAGKRYANSHVQPFHLLRSLQGSAIPRRPVIS